MYVYIYINLGCGHHVHILYLELSINSSFDFSSADGDDHPVTSYGWMGHWENVRHVGDGAILAPAWSHKWPRKSLTQRTLWSLSLWSSLIHHDPCIPLWEYMEKLGLLVAPQLFGGLRLKRPITIITAPQGLPGIAQGVEEGALSHVGKANNPRLQPTALYSPSSATWHRYRMLLKAGKNGLLLCVFFVAKIHSEIPLHRKSCKVV